jgi:phage FluMu protein Com
LGILYSQQRRILYDLYEEFAPRKIRCRKCNKKIDGMDMVKHIRKKHPDLGYDSVMVKCRTCKQEILVSDMNKHFKKKHG